MTIRPLCSASLLGTVSLGLALLAPLSARASDQPRWSSLSQTATCEAGHANYCHGYYGFHVDPAGHYRAGPAPSGALIEGTLETDELERIDAATRKVQAQMTRSRLINQTTYLANSSLTIRLHLEPHTELTAYRWNGDNGSVYYIGHQEDSFALRDLLKELMTKYYPVPFPVATPN